MTDNPYEKIGNTYYPKKNKDNLIGEVKGSYWRAWKEDKKFFYEFDAGHFSTKFKVIEILEEDFLSLMEGKADDLDIARKYKT